MRFAPPAPPPGKRAALVLAVAVHLLLAAILFYGIHWQSQASSAVEVELVRGLPAPQVRSQPAPQPAPQPKPEPKVEPKVEAKPEPQVETKPSPPPPKPEILQKEKPVKKLVEKPKPVEKPRPVDKPKPVEKPKPRSDPFQKQLEEDLKATDQRKASEAAARELAQLKSAQVAAALSKAQQAWQDKIAAKIKGNIVRPVGVTGDPEAVFEVTLLPDGSLVGEPRLRKSTGIPALDAAIERAISKSDPLPKPADPSIFERTLMLTFRPLEDQ